MQAMDPKQASFFWSFDFRQALFGLYQLAVRESHLYQTIMEVYSGTSYTIVKAAVGMSGVL